MFKKSKPDMSYEFEFDAHNAAADAGDYSEACV